MILRSRERKTLEALQDAVKYLGSVREERKAIITVTEGWVLYREDPDLMRQRSTERRSAATRCASDRQASSRSRTRRRRQRPQPGRLRSGPDLLAGIDNDRFLREIMDDANRGNSTFYMIDPSGLTTKRADRTGAMRTLAEGTDGFAMLSTNDLNKGFARIAATCRRIPARLQRDEHEV